MGDPYILRDTHALLRRVPRGLGFSVPGGRRSCSCGNNLQLGMNHRPPLEAKAGMDAVELRRQYGHRLGFCGGSDVQVWETGDRAAIKREVLRRLNAAKGGGYLFQSDHSVTSNVSGPTDDYIVQLVREFGKYPIQLPADVSEPV